MIMQKSENPKKFHLGPFRVSRLISLEEQEEDQEECSRGQIALLQLMFFAAASRPQTKQDLFIVF